MSHKLINLLPEDRVNAFRRGYFIRLATVTVCLLAILTIIHGIFLFPSYLALLQKKDVETRSLAEVDARLAGSKEQEIHARLSSLKGDATYLSRLSTVPSTSGTVRNMLAVPHPGISIINITVAFPTAGATSGKVSLSGTATTREALHTFNDTLSALPFVTGVDLPISSYAQESNIAFSLTVSGTFTP